MFPSGSSPGRSGRPRCSLCPPGQAHLKLYKAFPAIGGIVHTKNSHAVGWAQARQDIPCCGATHADYFYSPIPRSRNLTPREIEEDYEPSTGKVIVETFQERKLDPTYVPGVICAHHGPFT